MTTAQLSLARSGGFGSTVSWDFMADLVSAGSPAAARDRANEGGNESEESVWREERQAGAGRRQRVAGKRGAGPDLARALGMFSLCARAERAKSAHPWPPATGGRASARPRTMRAVRPSGTRKSDCRRQYLE